MDFSLINVNQNNSIDKERIKAETKPNPYRCQIIDNL